MVLSFHHHFRDGDYVVNMVMKEVAALGIKDITICASSLGAAHDPVADLIAEFFRILWWMQNMQTM